jgi:hypothetical protein
MCNCDTECRFFYVVSLGMIVGVFHAFTNGASGVIKVVFHDFISAQIYHVKFIQY